MGGCAPAYAMLALFAPARPLLAISDAVQVMVATDVNPAAGNGGAGVEGAVVVKTIVGDLLEFRLGG